MAKIKINPLFLLFILIFIFFGWLTDIIIYLSVLILHEYTHFFVAKIFGYKIKKMKLDFYGARLECPEIQFQPNHEVIISLSAPFLNLILFCMCLATWWLFPETFDVLYVFALANFSLGCFNLLPILPLDMGRVILTLLKSKVKIKVVYKIFKAISIIFATTFIIIFVVYAILVKINLSILFIALFLILSINDYNDTMYLDYTNKINKSYNSPLEIRTFILDESVNKVNLYKCISKNYFSQFVIIDQNHRIIKKFNEIDIINDKFDL